MDEIKRRTAVITAFGPGGAAALYKATTIESVYLQFRKILELIALGSLVANKNEFSKVYNDFAKCWNAQYLLKDLSSQAGLGNSFVTLLLTKPNGFGLTIGGPADLIESKSGADPVPEARSHGKRRIQI